MPRLTLDQPVIGARTADGSDAVKTVDPITFATLLGMGSMAFQNAWSVDISGGVMSGVYITGCTISGGSIDSTPIGADGPDTGTFTILTSLGDVIGGTGVWANQPITGGIVGVGTNSTTNWSYLSSTASVTTLAWTQGMQFREIYETGFGTGQTVVREVDTTGTQVTYAPARFDGNIGFYGETPIVQVVVSDPSIVVTVETAGGTYTSNEQDMLTHLKTDVTNLRSKLNDTITALKSYGIFG